MAVCRNCGGTGWLMLLNSMWKADGLRREHCGICGGSGQSDFRPSADFAAFQTRARVSFPRHPD